MKRFKRGLAVIEFLFAVVIVGVLMLFLLDRVDYYRESAEKAAMEQLAREMGWALRIRAAEFMLSNRWDEIGKMEASNPIDALEMRVANYAGRITNAQEPRAPAGRWYFNSDSRQLVYMPDLTSNFVKPEGARARVAWRVVVVEEASKPGARPRPLWVRLELAQPYRWLERNAQK